MNKGPSQKTQLATWIELYVRDHGFSGTVFIAKGDQVLFDQAYGWKNLEAQIPMQRESSLLIGSISKQFTATLVMQLVAEGKITLHQSIRHYLPALPAAWK